MLERLRLLRTYLSLKPFDVSTDEGRSNERYRRIALTSVSSLCAKAIQSLIVLITIPLTLDYLGLERYGLWLTISSSILFLSFVDFGLGLGLLNAVSDADGRNDQRATAVAISSAFFSFCGLFWVLLAALGICSLFISWPDFFSVFSEKGRDECAPAVWTLAICTAAGLPISVVQRVLLGLQEGLTSNVVTISGNFAGLIGLLLAIYFHAGLPWLVFAASGAPLVIMGLYGAYYFQFLRPDQMPQWRLYDRKSAKSMLSAGMMFLALQLLALLGIGSDNLIIARAMGPSEVPAYSVAFKLFYMTIIGQYFLQPLWAAYGEALARNDYRWIQHTFQWSILVSVASGALCALPLLVAGRWLIHTAVSPSLNISSSLLAGFYFYVLLHSCWACYSTLFNSGLFLAKHVIIMAVATLIGLTMKIIGVVNYGVEGLIWGHVIGFSIGYLPLAALTMRKCLLDLSNNESLTKIPDSKARSSDGSAIEVINL